MSKKPFLDLIVDPRARMAAVKAFDRALWQSFIEDTVRDMKGEALRNPSAAAIGQPTQRELRRRFAICERWFRIMRGDLKFGMQKTLDLLPQALRAELDGEDFNPPAGGWFGPMEEKFMTDEEKQLLTGGTGNADT